MLNIATIFGSLKGYLYAAGAIVFTALVGIYKYRGFKVEKLEAEVEEAEGKAAVTDKVIEAERKVNDFETQNKVAAAKAGQPHDYGVDHDEDPSKRFYSI